MCMWSCMIMLITEKDIPTDFKQTLKEMDEFILQLPQEA